VHNLISHLCTQKIPYPKNLRKTRIEHSDQWRSIAINGFTIAKKSLQPKAKRLNPWTRLFPIVHQWQKQLIE
jgi:hypothetical protein